MSELGRWYSPYKITFTYSQVTWLLKNLCELREGFWPQNPDGRSSGYTDPQIINKSSEYKAYVENIGAVVGTVERRLLKTGMDGAMAYLRFTVQLSYSEIARLSGIRKVDAYPRVSRAIKYCVGEWDKRDKYPFYSRTESGGI